jgi:putative flippase GtrA
MRTRSTLIRYLVIGVISFGVDFGLLVGFREIVGVPVWAAASAGFWGSFLINFLLNRHITFDSRGRARVQLLRYATLVAINYVTTVAIVAGLASLDVNYQLAKFLCTGLVAAWTYVVYRLWVFT